MNKWKIAFWSCWLLLVAVTVLSAYLIIDQSYTLTYHKVNYEDTEKDLDQLIEIINKTNLTKKQIERELRNRNVFEFLDFKSDTISLNRVLLIFSNEKLQNVTKQK